MQEGDNGTSELHSHFVLVQEGDNGVGRHENFKKKSPDSSRDKDPGVGFHPKKSHNEIF